MAELPGPAAAVTAIPSQAAITVHPNLSDDLAARMFHMLRFASGLERNTITSGGRFVEQVLQDLDDAERSSGLIRWRRKTDDEDGGTPAQPWIDDRQVNQWRQYYRSRLVP